MSVRRENLLTSLILSTIKAKILQGEKPLRVAKSGREAFVELHTPPFRESLKKISLLPLSLLILLLLQHRLLSPPVHFVSFAAIQLLIPAPNAV
jgi:hypothetical protein